MQDHFPILFKIGKTTNSSNIHVTLSDHEKILTEQPSVMIKLEALTQYPT